MVRAPSPLPSSSGGAKFLTGAADGDALDVALDYVRDAQNSPDFEPEDFETAKVSSRYVSRHNGVTHLNFKQQHEGIDVYNGLMSANVMPDGSIINLHNGFISQLADQVNRVEPLLTAEQAIESAAGFYKVPLKEPLQPLPVEDADGGSREQLFTDAGLSLDPIPAKLVYVAMGNDTTRLAWNTVIRFEDGDRWLDLNVDAETGDLLSQANWIASASYNVYAQPTETPNHGGRSIVTDPHNTAASPFGWHDTNGAAGAEFTDTRGNNVNAQDDTNANNTGGSRPSGGAGLNFDNPLNLANRPDTYLEAVTTNLFYWNNIIHDVFWHYGFDEASGNFQENNYGNGGAAGDPVEADSQDGSGTNNANFGTPPDGSNPRMQMFIWTFTDPNRDSSIDNGIIVHEYAHGVSNRLTGGPANSSALSANQSRGMGEGWGDWLGLSLTATASDTSTRARGIGTYVFGEPTSGPGIRPFRYTTDMNVNPQTFGDLAGGTLSVPHGIGSVWCTTLWEVYWELVTAHGFDPDLYNGTGGNNIALQLIVDGMKLQPATPTFLDARDAIILADQVNNGGANFVRLWTAFAKRGMGASADDGGDPNSLAVTEAFDLPDDLDVTPSSQQRFQSSGAPGGPFLPAIQTYTLNNSGSSALDWTAAVDVPWLDVSASSGTLAAGNSTTVDVSVNAGANALAADAYRGIISFTNTTSTAVLQRNAILAVTDLTDAVDEPALTFSTDQPLWYRQTVVSHDGVDAAQSGNAGAGGTTWMETTISGPDTLNFYWKVDSESGRDFLRFLVDDVVREAISGDVDWNRISFDIPAGDHVLRWEYVKNGSNNVGADAGWVDGMALASQHPEPLITSDLTALVATGEAFSYQIEATASPTSYSSSSLPTGLSLNASSGEISGIPTVTGNYPVDITASNGSGSSTETFTIVVYDLSEALDEPGMNFTSAIPLWFVQSQVTHDGVDALQAGDVSDNESSYVEATVTGPTDISFFWKVDSEGNWDYLRFRDNGVQREARPSVAMSTGTRSIIRFRVAVMFCAGSTTRTLVFQPVPTPDGWTR